MDTPGKNQSVLKEYYEKAKGVILVFSLTDKASFEGIENWMAEGLKGLKVSTPVILVGNKQDSVEKVIDPEKILQISEKYKLKYFEVSAKNNFKIEEMFLGVVNQIKPQIERLSSSMEIKSKGILLLLRKADVIDNTPRRLTLQSHDFSQNILTQKIQEQISSLKSELYFHFEELSKNKLLHWFYARKGNKDMELMEEKMKKLEEKLLLKEQKEISQSTSQSEASSPEFPMNKTKLIPQNVEQFQLSIEKNIANPESKTLGLIQEMKEENKTLMEKMFYLEESLRGKSENTFRRSVDNRNEFDEGADKGSVLLHDVSVMERDGERNFEDELYELKRRVEDSDEKMANNMIIIENKIKLTAMNIIKEVNQKLLGVSNPAHLSDEKYSHKDEDLHSEERGTQSTSNISPPKSKKV